MIRTSGAAPFSFSKMPLVHAEPVLLVDHGQRQVGELDPFLHQRVRADDEVDLAVADAVDHVLPVVAGDRSGQERVREGGCRIGGRRRSAGSPPKRLTWSSGTLFRRATRLAVEHVAGAERGEQRLRAPEVLRGKHFGGRHDRGLVARLDRDHGGVERDRRLARAHVALQQTVHRSAVGHVVADLLVCPGLRLGQGERQPADERVGERAVPVVLDTDGVTLEAPLAERHAQLERRTARRTSAGRWRHPVRGGRSGSGSSGARNPRRSGPRRPGRRPASARRSAPSRCSAR